MKTRKTSKPKRATPVVVAGAPGADAWIWICAASVVIALFAAFGVYWPAIHGPFLFDDMHLTYMLPNAADLALREWLNQTRPLLMFTFWLNYQLSGAQETFGYHAVNVLLHFFNALFAFLAIRKVLSWASVEESRNRMLSLFAAGIFLLHPLQTESVSYVASRSETLSVFFVLAAFVVFLYRPGATLSLSRILALLALFACAALSKEHTVVLPVLFILGDYYWNFEFSPSVIWRNWKLYVPIAAGAAFASVGVLRILRGNPSAGFQMQGLTWYQYFFTECRVIWDYIRLFLVPIGQNLDPDIEISRTVTAHGAIFGLAGLLGVSVLAWIYRRRFPIASYGWFAFLILLAPTSSFAPIRDPLVERRLYLPFIGLLLISVEFLRRWKASKNLFVGSLALVLVAEGVMTYQRNLLWGNAVDIWKDAVSKSPRKMRPRFHLALAYIQAGSCSNAVDEFQQAAALELPTYDPMLDWEHELLRDWGLAYDCAGNPQQAIAKFQQAVVQHPDGQLYAQMGMEYGKIRQYPEALDALATAQELDPGFALTYYNLGNIHAIQGNQAQAIGDYERVLALDPHNAPARAALVRMGIR
ncbi:MAG: tetratricopeptide repeat protein [Bryobacteraceae bacterium]|jgi:Tfp pilus assembly protein PilF